MTDPTEERAEPEDTARSATWPGQVKRWAFRYFWHGVFAFVALLGGMGFSILRGVFAAPGKLAKLAPQIALLQAEQTAMKLEAADANQAVWTLVTFECLKLPQGDSLFIRTKLNCGMAYDKSGFNKIIRR